MNLHLTPATLATILFTRSLAPAALAQTSYECADPTLRSHYEEERDSSGAVIIGEDGTPSRVLRGGVSEGRLSLIASPRYASSETLSCGARAASVGTPPSDGEVERCNLRLAAGGRSYTFSDSGLVYVTQEVSGGAPSEHSYYFFPRGSRQPRVTLDGEGHMVVSRGGLSFSLSGSTGRMSHILRGASRTTIYPVTDTGSSTDLGVSTLPSDTLMLDLGETAGGSRGYASVAVYNPRTGACDIPSGARSRTATIRAAVNGIMQSCEVPLTSLFTYEAMDGRAPFSNMPVCRYTEADRTAMLAACDEQHTAAIAALGESPAKKAVTAADRAHTTCRGRVPAAGSLPPASDASRDWVRCVPRFIAMDAATARSHRDMAGGSRHVWQSFLDAGDAGLQDANLFMLLSGSCPQLGEASLLAFMPASAGEAAEEAARARAAAEAGAEPGDCDTTVMDRETHTVRQATVAECRDLYPSRYSESAEEGRSPDSAGRKHKTRKGHRTRRAH